MFIKFQGRTLLLIAFFLFISFFTIAKKRKKNYVPSLLKPDIVIKGFNKSVTAIIFLEDNKWLMAGYETGKFIKWDLDTKKAVATYSFPKIKEPITAIQYIPGESDVVMISTISNTVYTVNLEQRKIQSSDDKLVSNCFHVVTEDGKFLFSSVNGAKGSFAMYNLLLNKKVKTYSGQSGKVIGVQVSKNKKHIASFSSTGHIYLWDAISGTIKKKFVKEKGTTCIMFGKGETESLYAINTNRELKVFDIIKRVEKTKRSLPKPGLSFSFSKDGEHLAVGTFNGEIYVINNPSKL